jgi:uncharacterized repeat protein (TIGR02543 family)
MLKKRNLIFLSLLILGVLLLTSCFLKPPVTEGILKGQVLVPEGSIQAKQLTGQALADATVNIIDPVTGDIIATTTTDANGYYQVFVPAGGPYLLQAVKDGVKLQQVTPQVEVGIEYDLGTVDCATTAVALIAQAMLEDEDYPDNLADINLTDIEADPDFDDVMSDVCSKIAAGEDPALSAVVQQAVEDFLHPPTPTPTPTPTYTVTYDGNTNTGGDVPTDANLYVQGATVKVLNQGSLVKTDYTFVGWNTAAAGTGTGYPAGSTFTMGTANVILYAQWTINEYTVTYDSQGGSAVDSQTVEHGGKAIEPTAPTKEGYTFCGWYKEPGCTNAWNFATDTVTSNVTLYAKWTAYDYSLRDIGPAGGLIFYVKGSYSGGWRYLEAAPATTEWTEKEWGKYETEVGVTAQGTDVGTGKANTMAIVAKLNEDPPDSDRAAQLCNDLEVVNSSVTYDDWFLPSKDELNLMYVNLHKEGVGGFAGFYWSSSESYATTAWYQSFDNGNQTNTSKNSTARVRAVRAF